MMVTIKRTNSDDKDFQKLVKHLDAYLKILDGAEHSFYNQLNKIDTIKHAVVAYNQNNQPVGCGAIREYMPGTMEVKRMYVPESSRGQGIASIVLKELENWSREMAYKKCVLETGKRQPEAIALYTKNGYQLIGNYGKYANMENSVCYEKLLLK